MSALLSKIGPVMQMAYVPRDFDAALTFWTEVIGAGPFFVIPSASLIDAQYRGQPTDADFSLALGYWGDMQIELIKPLDEHRSIFNEWRDVGKEGLHHLCILTEDMARARKICGQVGAKVLQEATVPGGTQVIYVETGGGDGTIVEILEINPSSPDVFAVFKAASVNWDGIDPIRTLG